jgi:hypothetical protein
MQNFELVKERMKAVEEKDHIRNWQPPLSGEDIIRIFGISPGRQVGIIKDAIKEAILDGIIPNTYEAAYQFMLQKTASLNLQPV